MLACNRALCKERKGKGENECEWDKEKRWYWERGRGFVGGWDGGLLASVQMRLLWH